MIVIASSYLNSALLNNINVYTLTCHEPKLCMIYTLQAAILKAKVQICLIG